MGRFGGGPERDTAGCAVCVRAALRTRRTARHISTPVVSYTTSDGAHLDWVQMRPKAFRNLDELYAGLCDGMTYEEIADNYPDEAEARGADKFQYRYPRGESYTDLIARLEPLVDLLAERMQRVVRSLALMAAQQKQPERHVSRSVSLVCSF